MLTNLKSNTVKLTLIAMFTALMVVISQLSIPMPSGVPISIQPFGVALIGFLLGLKYGTVSITLYLAIGAIGLPVFSNATGGFGAIAGYTGGFLWGFILMVAICGVGLLISNKITNLLANKICICTFGIIGLVVCDICGSFQYGLLAQKDLITASLVVAVPYLVKDIILVICAYLLSQTINFALRNSKFVY